MDPNTRNAYIRAVTIVVMAGVAIALYAFIPDPSVKALAITLALAVIGGAEQIVKIQ